MPLQLEDLAALDAPTQQHGGQPLSLPVEAIDEDPEQPRRDFDANRLDDLAETIRIRGVRQPISVRPDPQRPGRWVLNFGARRLRASKIAGLAEIPAFIDITADSYDQVIENEQREGLKPLDLALFVQKRIALGDNQSEIAKRLGKSRQWVTLTTALIEPPDWLLQVYREGRCRGMNELYELRRLHGEHGVVVETWAAEHAAITRDQLAMLRARLETATAMPVPLAPDAAPSEPTLTRDTGASDCAAGRPVQTQRKLAPASSARGHDRSKSDDFETGARSLHRVHVEFDGQDYQLVVSRAPDRAACMYVRPLSGGPRRLAPVASLKLLGFVRS